MVNNCHTKKKQWNTKLELVTKRKSALEFTAISFDTDFSDLNRFFLSIFSYGKY